MSFDTYANLQIEIASWLRRADLTTSIPGFIGLAESQMNRRIRTSEMVKRAQAVLSDEYSTVPTNFAGIRTFEIVGSPVQQLEYLDPDTMTRVKAQSNQPSGKPRYFSVVGSEFQYLPVPDADYTAALTYWETIPTLSIDNPTNWLLTAHPDAYLYGALAQSAPFLRADERLPMWVSAFGQILEDINTDEERKASAAMGASLAVFPGVYNAGGI